jgi:hypothetical protein
MPSIQPTILPTVLEPYSGLLRIPFIQECRIVQGGRTQPARMFNLSALGTYLVMDPIPTIGESFTLSFRLREHTYLTIDAVVTWCNTAQGPGSPALPPGCGLRFLGLGSQDREAIQSFVKAYTTEH